MIQDPNLPRWSRSRRNGFVAAATISQRSTRCIWQPAMATYAPELVELDRHCLLIVLGQAGALLPFVPRPGRTDQAASDIMESRLHV
jgi:hypothetical protein